MRISQEDLQRCFAMVATVCEAYEARELARHNVRSVDSLVAIASDVAGRPVTVRYLAERADERLVKGMCVIRADRCDVVILAGLNTCWHRFVLCKELFHAFLDCDEYRSMDLEKHLESMFSLFQVDPEDTDKTTNAEIIAELAAMEFLFPYKARVACIEAGKSIESMALQYRVPNQILGRYLTAANMEALAPFCGEQNAAIAQPA